MRFTIAALMALYSGLCVSCTEQLTSLQSTPVNSKISSLPAPAPKVRPPSPIIGSPWNAIGRINRQHGGYCSGTLIAPKRVLTTAHCLWDAQLGHWTPPEDLHFLAGFDRGKYLAHRKAVDIELPSHIRMSAQGAPAKAIDDWAILTLDRPIESTTGVRPIKIMQIHGRINPSSVGPLVRIGYGPLRPYALQSERCQPVILINPLVLLHSCNATFAETGFPILVHTGHGWRVLGLEMLSLKKTKLPKGLGMALLVTALAVPHRTVGW